MPVAAQVGRVEGHHDEVAHSDGDLLVAPGHWYALMAWYGWTRRTSNAS